MGALFREEEEEEEEEEVEGTHAVRSIPFRQTGLASALN